MGAKLRRIGDSRDGSFRVAILDLHDFCIELLEPVDPNGFLAKHLETRGEGIHHITLQTPDLERKTLLLEASGIRVVEKEFADPNNIGAFISPKSAHGRADSIGPNLGAAEQSAALGARIAVGGYFQTGVVELGWFAPIQEQAAKAMPQTRESLGIGASKLAIRRN